MLTGTPVPEGTSTLQGLTWIMCQTSWLQLFKAMPVNARKVLRIADAIAVCVTNIVLAFASGGFLQCAGQGPADCRKPLA